MIFFVLVLMKRTNYIAPEKKSEEMFFFSPKEKNLANKFVPPMKGQNSQPKNLIG